jgi:hypothetical protein
LLMLASCAPVEFEFRTTGNSSRSGSVGVQGGGARFALGEASVLYGSLLENGQRRYSYLVIGPKVRGGEAHFNSVGSVYCEGDITGSASKTEDECTFGEAKITANFAATVGPKGTFEEQKLTLQGVEFDPGSGWLYLFDASKSGDAPRLHKIDLEMPELPESGEGLLAFTMEFVARLIEEDPIVAAFVNS